MPINNDSVDLSSPFHSEILVVGIGGVLSKDDAFGPTVIKSLELYLKKGSINKEDITPEFEDIFTEDLISSLNNYFDGKDITIPENVQLIDGGTSSTFHIFSLPDEYWKKVIVVDVVGFNAEPGTIKLFDIFEIPEVKYLDAHVGPTNTLRDLAEKQCEVVVIGCRPKEIPENEILCGLTEPVEKAIPEAIDYILNEIGVL